MRPNAKHMKRKQDNEEEKTPLVGTHITRNTLIHL